MLGSPDGASGKEYACQFGRRGFDSWVGKIPWRRIEQLTPVFLAGESHGRGSLVGCSPWRHQESDTTEWLHFHFSHSYTGEGNGNPLQYSWLENPMDGGAWWATVPGVVKSQTRLNMHARKFHTCLSLHISVSLSITGCVSTWIPFFLCVFVYLTLQVSSLCSFISQMIPIFFFCGGGAVGNLG